MKKTKLEPCPLCRKEVSLEYYAGGFQFLEYHPFYAIVCPQHKIVMTKEIIGPSVERTQTQAKNALIKQWNTEVLRIGEGTPDDNTPLVE